MTEYKTMAVDGVSMFYREAGPPDAPKLVLLGGFPASSHQFRNLIPALADRFHVLSPDYPGFGNSEMPDPASFPYTFDRLSEVVEGLLERTGFTRAGFFMQDYGGPVGFRLLGRRPEWMAWLILQNTNAYEEGFTPAWDGIRFALWQNRGAETEAPLLPFLDLEGIKLVYQHASALTTGRWTSVSWSGPARVASSSTCSTTIEPTSPSIQRGSSSCERDSRRRSSSGANATSSSPPKAVRPTSAICRERSCIASRPDTSPSKTAST
jgi:pimeloyl-ACP methyl ester carboxylesterase